MFPVGSAEYDAIVASINAQAGRMFSYARTFRRPSQWKGVTVADLKELIEGQMQDQAVLIGQQAPQVVRTNLTRWRMQEPTTYATFTAGVVQRLTPDAPRDFAWLISAVLNAMDGSPRPVLTETGSPT